MAEEPRVLFGAPLAPEHAAFLGPGELGTGPNGATPIPADAAWQIRTWRRFELLASGENGKLYRIQGY